MSALYLREFEGNDIVGDGVEYDGDNDDSDEGNFCWYC